MKSTGGGGEAEHQAGGGRQGGRRGPARSTSSRRRGRTGGGGDGRGEEEENRRRGRRTAGKHARKVVLKAANAADHADQAAEDRPVAVLRRQQEREEDKVAVLRRQQGLPTRVLIDKGRGRWGVDRQEAHIANALFARRISVAAARLRLHYHSGLQPQEVEYIEAKDGTIVLARHLQDEILARIDHNWRQTEQGKEFVQKARNKVAAAAQRRQQRGAGASTPGQAVGTEPQFERAMRSYFRTHCDQTYGGQVWLKLLITFDDIPKHAVDSYNDLCVARAMEKRGKSPGEFADLTPDRAYLSRADRASTPVPSDYVRPGVRRRQAKARLDTLRRMMDEGIFVDPACFDAAKQVMAEAEEASQRSLHAFTSYWTSERRNAFASMEASMFETVLQSTLKHYGLDAQQIETIMRDRSPKGKGKHKDEMLGTIMNKRNPHEAGSASMPALTQGSTSTPARRQGRRQG